MFFTVYATYFIQQFFNLGTLCTDITVVDFDAPVKYPKGLWDFLSRYDNIIEVDGNIAIVEENERYGLINIEKREEIIPLGLKGKEFLEKLREFPN